MPVIGAAVVLGLLGLAIGLTLVVAFWALVGFAICYIVYFFFFRKGARPNNPTAAAEPLPPAVVAMIVMCTVAVLLYVATVYVQQPTQQQVAQMRWEQELAQRAYLAKRQAEDDLKFCRTNTIQNVRQDWFVFNSSSCSFRYEATGGGIEFRARNTKLAYQPSSANQNLRMMDAVRATGTELVYFRFMLCGPYRRPLADRWECTPEPSIGQKIFGFDVTDFFHGEPTVKYHVK